VYLIFDTGSSETWVNPDCATLSNATLCIASGQYDPANSSTSQTTIGLNFIQYGTGSVLIQYAVDNIAMPGSGEPRAYCPSDAQA
jgi:hypothetical protein